MTVLSLRTIRTCLLDSTSSSSTPASLTNALSGWAGLERESTIESGNEVLLEIVVSRIVIANAVKPEFLRQLPWIVPKARSLRPRVCGERARI